MNDKPNELKLPAQAFLNRCFFDLSSTLGRTVNLIFMLLVIASVFITYIFATEYTLRLYSARWRKAYALSFNGIIDLLTWLPLIVFGMVSFPLRLLRILRLLKLLRYMRSLRALFSSMSDIANLIFVVLSSITIIVIVFGNTMFLIEPQTFPNAFIGSWWSLTTMTTVGYGDIVPQTGLGKAIAAVLILIGISMFALLTGTISARLSEHLQLRNNCKECGLAIPNQSHYCLHCGIKMPLSDDAPASKNYSPLEEAEK